TPHPSSVIEAHAKFDWLESMGLTAIDCLLDIATVNHQLTVLASGGVRNPLDVVRAQALGASAVGMAGSMLRVAMSDGAEGVTEVLNLFKTRIRQVYALLGVRTGAQLTQTDVMVTWASAERARARNIDVTRFADRARISRTRLVQRNTVIDPTPIEPSKSTYHDTFTSAVPTRRVGPLRMSGAAFDGAEEIDVPLATYEAPLWPSVGRGAKISRMLSSGITATVHDERMTRSVLFTAPDAGTAQAAAEIIQTRF